MDLKLLVSKGAVVAIVMSCPDKAFLIRSGDDPTMHRVLSFAVPNVNHPYSPFSSYVYIVTVMDVTSIDAQRR